MQGTVPLQGICFSLCPEEEGRFYFSTRRIRIVHCSRAALDASREAWLHLLGATTMTDGICSFTYDIDIILCSSIIS